MGTGNYIKIDPFILKDIIPNMSGHLWEMFSVIFIKIIIKNAWYNYNQEDQWG